MGGGEKSGVAVVGGGDERVMAVHGSGEGEARGRVMVVSHW